MYWYFNCCAVCTFYVPFRILIVSGHLLGNSGFLGLRYVLFALVPDCQFSLSDLWFWSGTFILIAPFPDHCLLLPFHNVIELLLVSRWAQRSSSYAQWFWNECSMALWLFILLQHTKRHCPVHSSSTCTCMFCNHPAMFLASEFPVY